MTNSQKFLLTLSIFAGIAISLLYEYYFFTTYVASIKIDGPISFSYDENIYSILRGLVLFICMLIGIFAKASWDIINNSKKKTGLKLWQTLKKIISSKFLWLPIIISPILFYQIYSLSESQPNNLVGFILAFQNGFFWKSVFTEDKND